MRGPGRCVEGGQRGVVVVTNSATSGTAAAGVRIVVRWSTTSLIRVEVELVEKRHHLAAAVRRRGQLSPPELVVGQLGGVERPVADEVRLLQLYRGTGAARRPVPLSERRPALRLEPGESASPEKRIHSGSASEGPLSYSRRAKAERAFSSSVWKLERTCRSRIAEQ